MDRNFKGKWTLRGSKDIELKRYSFDDEPLLLRTTGTTRTAETLTVTASGIGVVLRARNGAFVAPHSVRTSWAPVLGATPGDPPFELGVGETQDGFIFLWSPWQTSSEGKEIFTCWGRSPGTAFLLDSMISSAMSAAARQYGESQIRSGKVLRWEYWRRTIVTPDMATILATKELPGVDLDGVDLSEADLSGKDFTGAHLVGANLSGANLHGATLDGADLTGATLDAADLTGASMKGVTFDRTDLTRTRFSPTPDFGSNPERRTSFVRAVVPLETLNKRWSCLDLTSARIDGLGPGADLTGLQALDTVAPDLVMSGTDLSNACFDRAFLQRAVFDKSTLKKATFRHADANLAQFSGAVAPGAVFDNAELHQTNFTGATLEDASFDGALLGASELDINADFTDATLTRAVFNTAHLYGVTFSHTLAGDIVLSGAQADRARFVRAYMVRANFGGGAELRGADFGAGCFLDADFRTATISPSSNVRASFAGACLQGALFDGAALGGASFKAAGLAAKPGKFPVTLPGPSGPRRRDVPHRASSLPPGDTGGDNVCPDGSGGPCDAPSWNAPDAPKAWRYANASESHDD